MGAGPAGIAAALQARELGAEVTLLEADQAGGTSLNRGPAPVRTLARAARLMRDSLAELPGRAAVVGGADTGCQIASILADLGATVEVFEAGPSLVPSADTSISMNLCRAFERKGIRVHTHTQTLVEELQRRDGQIGVCYRRGSAGARTDVDAVFFAVGSTGNIDELGLETAGVRAERHPGRRLSAHQRRAHLRRRRRQWPLNACPDRPIGGSRRRAERG